MPPASPDTAAADRASRPRRGLKWTLFVLAAALIGVLVVVAVWGANRYQQAVSLARRAQDQYQTLNASHPFAPPPVGAPLPAERWAAMLRVRERLLAQASPELRRTLDGLLKARTLRDPALLRRAMAAVPELEPLLEGQLEALRAEQMSPRAYQWMLGRAIGAALAAPARASEAGRGYAAVLAELERLTRADGDPNNDLYAESAVDFFQAAYRGAAPPPPDVLDRLARADTAARALDLLTAAAQWITPEQAGAVQDLPRRLMAPQ